MNLYQLFWSHLVVVSIMDELSNSVTNTLMIGVNAKSIAIGRDDGGGDDDVEDHMSSGNNDASDVKECRRKCDTMYGIQCVHAVESYENYFLCMNLSKECKV